MYKNCAYTGSTFTFTRDRPRRTLPLFYLRTYARKNYAAVEIHVKTMATLVNYTCVVVLLNRP